MARNRKSAADETPDEGPLEIGVVGDLNDQEADICDKLLSVPRGGQCTLYFDSPGGSPYCAISLMTLIAMRELDATGIVTGECSSAALWPLAACRRRIVTPYSVMLFHPMKSQSEESVGLAEAAEWARHFAELEVEMDKLLAAFFGITPERLAQWMSPGRYVTGREFAEAGLAELMDLTELAKTNRAPPFSAEKNKRLK
jgi:ATP-dependent Clp protease protease subunit